MKTTITILAIAFSTLFLSAQSTTSFHSQIGIAMSGDTVSMSAYYGKKVMVVNCASFCSFTPQYAPLQQLYDQYAAYGFEIIGFPSDDFASQGGSDSEIVTTCQSYGVTFPIMATIHVSASEFGNDVEPIFQWLEKESLNGVSDATVGWNFNKFLIDEAGTWIRHYDSNKNPLDTSITNWIMTPSVISSLPQNKIDDLVEIKSPNPTNSFIHFTLKNTTPEPYNFTILNTQGQLIATIFEGVATPSQNIQYAVNDLATGLYFVSVKTNNQQHTYRISVIK